MNRKVILLCLAVVAGSLLFLRTCVPQLWGPSLPASVIRRITDDHTICIGIDEVPVWPGEPRQAQCSTVSIKVIADGSVPTQQARLGEREAVCYVLTVEHPYWETMGQTRHEILTSARTSYKVAILQNDVWNVFPDDDIQDRARWSLYACPTPPLQP
jgi:hypothetical protein